MGYFEKKMECASKHPCNSWNCTSCSRKKLYWLREKCVRFARLLSFQQTYVSTLKPFKNAHDAHLAVNTQIAAIKALKSPHSAKFEYFYVISKHNFSEFHVHLFTNRYYPFFTAYHEKTRDKKAFVLYCVENLKWSIHADYGGVRRYGASQLLNKQSMKSWYKIRLRLWRIRTRQHLVSVLVNFIRSLAYSVDVTSQRVANRRIPMTIKPSTPDAIRQVARPPPRQTI